MRIVGLLSWFDEDPDLLYRAVGSHAPHVDHVVALDGRYAAYPAERTTSRPEEYAAIREACADAGTMVTVEGVSAPWDGPYGGEVAKRAHLFRLGQAVTSDTDWYWVFDGDVVVREAVGDWRHQLATTRKLAAEVEVVERHRRIPHTCLFRALRGLTVSNVHWRYHVPGGPELWGPLADAPLSLSEDVVCEHRDWEREQPRVAQRRRYYRHRDRTSIEKLDAKSRAAERRLIAERRARLRQLFDAAADAAGATRT